MPELCTLILLRVSRRDLSPGNQRSKHIPLLCQLSYGYLSDRQDSDLQPADYRSSPDLHHRQLLLPVATGAFAPVASLPPVHSSKEGAHHALETFCGPRTILLVAAVQTASGRFDKC